MTAPSSGASAAEHPGPVEGPLLRVRDLVVEFPAGRGRKLRAVSGVSFDVARNETLGVVGESGCGKSTTGRAILQMPRPTSGSVEFNGLDLAVLGGEQLRRIRPRLQMIFQDPISSLNPRHTVRQIVAEGRDIWGSETLGSGRAVDDMLSAVGLDPDTFGDRLPHQLSGGQCQRVCIARALVMAPELLLCDEPVSALDVSVQAQILNLLEDVKEQFGLTMLFVAHDLAVVRRISDRVMVMYLGKVCEIAPSDTLFEAPAHHYTQLLLDSVPSRHDPDGTYTRSGELPSATSPPSGCRYRTRCPAADQLCADVEPPLREVAPGQFVACHHPRHGADAGPAGPGQPAGGELSSRS